MFSFYSYRDPFPLESLKSFIRSIEWFKSLDGPTEQDILEAKLSIFKALDAPVDINALGMTEFIYKMSDSEKEERRKRLLSISLSDIKKLVDHWWPGNSGPKTCSVIIGGGPNITVDNNWKIIKGGREFFS